MFHPLSQEFIDGLGILGGLLNPDPMVLITLPILLGVVLIMVIAMWIGWTMLTTPAPEPLEDFDFDEEEVAEKKEE
ncbi:MAG: transcriptional regulator [Candidatus Thorarchaeota archaeon]